MIFFLEKRDHQFSSQEHNSMLNALGDGKYIVKIYPLNEQKTERDFQNQYFAILEEISQHQGDSKYKIHTQVKKHAEIDSTKDLSIEAWIKFLDVVKWWAYTNLDMVF